MNQEQNTRAPDVTPVPQQRPNAKQAPPPPPQYLLDTLNESVGETLWRDLKMILLRTYQVVWIFGHPSNPEVYEQWDIFGPLFYSLVLGLLYHFTSLAAGVINNWILPVTICVIFVIGFIVALNSTLLGAKANVMGTIALLGYCIAPMILGAVVTIILVSVKISPNWILTLVCCLVAAACATWCLFATYGFFRNLLPKGKIFMGVYPVFFYFIVLAIFMILPALKSTP